MSHGNTSGIIIILFLQWDRNEYQEVSATFSPIGVIEHQGSVVGTTVTGHYTADVFNHSTNQWYRTSDSSKPNMITKENLSKMGYIFLYKKVSG